MAKTNTLEGQLGFTELVFGYRPVPHHREMVSAIRRALIHRRDTLILMPAGSAKTTWGNTGTITWLVSMFPDVRIGLVSETSDFAEDFSGAVMNTLESNEIQHELFGNIAFGRKWTRKAWHRKGSRWENQKDMTVLAVGTGGQVASKRFDVLIADDVLGKSNTETVDQREKVKQWWDQALDPRIVASGVRIVFGTRWAEGDLYETLAAPTEEGGYGYDVHTIQAILPVESYDEARENGWVVEPDRDGQLWRSYWQSYWPISKLLQLRARNPATFDAVYQQDVGGLLSGDVFQRSWYKREDFYFDRLPEGHIYTTRMGGDLATSISERADWTAYVTTAEDRCPPGCVWRGHFYVLDADRVRIPAGHMEWFDHHFHQRPQWVPQPGLMILENQQFQSTVVTNCLTERPQTPVKGIRADSDKRTRATAVAEKYRMGFVHHHRSLKEGILEREQLAFTGRGTTKDDLVDACGYSMELGGGAFFFGKVDMRRPG